MKCDELKAYIAPTPDGTGLADYYLKSEADKVIAEKDAAIAELKEQVHDYAQGLYVLQARAEKEARHQKYKRCLGIAAVCFEKSYSTTLVKYDKESGLLRNFYDWWGERWLELAEKFKPNSTAKYGKG